MVYMRRLLLIFLLLNFLLLHLFGVFAFPSSSFTKSNGYWFDDWNINRNYYAGRNGYLPNMAYETIDENKELAFSIGEAFKENYQTKTTRAIAILKYVQKWTEYGYDEENVFREGVAQDEWAWNADEMAHAFNETTGIVATGDCEDLAFLCAAIYKGAGFDVAIVDAPGHVALLIWLPEFANADNYWDIPNDGRGGGWIWVEATGDTNPLGWTPPDYENGEWIAYPVGYIEPIPETKQLPLNEIIIVSAMIVAIILTLLVVSKSRRTSTAQTYWSLPPPPPP
ncbi:MAG: hypothetical protein N3D85_00930 [Candidatus Bathyarchaeota archaeon]|nr:hypothetical protein [Candidatus Bathyarchaeota archaeon]